MERPVVLSLGGWDPCGGAGLAADIKTLAAHNVIGMGIATAITYQTEDRFVGLSWVTTGEIIRQLRPIAEQYRFAAVKIGLIRSVQAIIGAIDLLKSRQPGVPIVWDPVIGASAGFGFHRRPSSFIRLMGDVTLLTPNLSEAALIFGNGTTVPQLNHLIGRNGWGSILLKGGHADGHANDLLLCGKEVATIGGVPFPNNGKHGSGCVFSSAVAANLAKGASLLTACENAKRYTEKFLLSSPSLLGVHD
ncbi:MAG: hydroxymethylpyrimidine/phosphomethylpyrimidine kinase [Breznakibacter sp.]